MGKLIGRAVMFIPACMYKNDTGRGRSEDIKPVRGVIVSEHKAHGWFRIKYTAGNTVQHECFKPCDIGKDVTLLGRR